MIQIKFLIPFALLFLSSSQFLHSQSKNENTITIDSCIQIALLNNYELKVFEQNKGVALQQYKIQKGKLLPTVSLSSEYLFTDQFDDLDVYNTGNASIRLYQPIWQNGKIKTTVKQAKINSEAAEIQFSIDRSDIIYYTTESYINLLRNEKIIELTNKMLVQFLITVDAAKERFKLGVSKRSDVLKAETEYSNIQYLAIQVETSGKIAEQNLLKALAYPLDSTINPQDFLQETNITLENSTTDSLIALANIYLPELKLIGKQIQRQELSVLIGKKDQFPEIRAFASYNWIDNPLYSKEFYGTIGLSLRFNIFSGLQKKNSIALEKVSLQQLNFQEEEIQQSVANEIQIAQLRLFEAREQINNAKSQVKSSKETLEVTMEEYLQGLSSMLELIDAQYADFGANRNLINAEAEYHLAATMLKRKTGILTIQ